MNQIEQMFYDAWEEFSESYDSDRPIEDIQNDVYCPSIMLEVQPTIGIYKVDFKLNMVLIEIDGHEFHKTKEQRCADYIRERFLQSFVVYPTLGPIHQLMRYKIIRFTASEVFVNPLGCVLEAIKIANNDFEVNCCLDELDWRRK